MSSISVPDIEAVFDLPDFPPMKTEIQSDLSKNQDYQGKSLCTTPSATQIPEADGQTREETKTDEPIIAGKEGFQIPGAFPSSLFTDPEPIPACTAAAIPTLPEPSTTGDDTITLLLSASQIPITVAKSIFTSRIPFFKEMFSGSPHDLARGQLILIRIPISCVHEFKILESWAGDHRLPPMTAEGKKEWNFNPVHLSSLAHLLSLPELESQALEVLKTAYGKDGKMEHLGYIRDAFEMTPPEGMLCRYLSKLLTWIIVGFEDREDSPFSNLKIQELLQSSDELLLQVIKHFRGSSGKGSHAPGENGSQKTTMQGENGAGKSGACPEGHTDTAWKQAQEKYLWMEEDLKVEGARDAGNTSVREAEQQGGTRKGDEDGFPLQRMKGILRNW